MRHATAGPCHATPGPEPYPLHPDDPEGHLNKLATMFGGCQPKPDGWETAPDYRGGHIDICPQCLADTRDLSPKSQALREKIWGHHMYFFCSACNRTMGCPSQVFPPPGWRMTKDHKCYCPRHSALQPGDATSLLKEVVAEIEAFKWGNPDKLRLDTVTGRIGLALELWGGPTGSASGSSNPPASTVRHAHRGGRISGSASASRRLRRTSPNTARPAPAG